MTHEPHLHQYLVSPDRPHRHLEPLRPDRRPSGTVRASEVTASPKPGKIWQNKKPGRTDIEILGWPRGTEWVSYRFADEEAAAERMIHIDELRARYHEKPSDREVKAQERRRRAAADRARRASLERHRCLDCGFTGLPQAVAGHQEAVGHDGVVIA